jgi:hypothetical protein
MDRETLALTRIPKRLCPIGCAAARQLGQWKCLVLCRFRGRRLLWDGAMCSLAVAQNVDDAEDAEGYHC